MVLYALETAVLWKRMLLCDRISTSLDLRPATLPQVRLPFATCSLNAAVDVADMWLLYDHISTLLGLRPAWCC